jgi:hypothetical protein
VIGASAPEASLAACLEGLEPQRGDAQVLVVEASPSSAALRERFSWAEFHEQPDALVPHLWSEGIAYARGRIVALTIAQMIPAADWLDRIREECEQHDAVGGAIDPGERLRLVDWAEYLCRYARDMPPFDPNDHDELAGDNAAYKRELLLSVSEALADGFWEPVVHPALREQGARFWHTPSMLVRQGRSCGFAAFARQRTEHGRLYAHQRGGNFTRARNAIGVLAAPAVAFLMTARVARRVFAKRRFRLRTVTALPLVLALNGVWAFAEARGHLELALDR